MFASLDSFRILTAAGPLYLALAGLAAVALTVLVYRHTRPVVRPALRYLLAGLRTAVLLLILLALFELTLQLRRVQTTSPVLAVAIDASASMQQRDAGTKRADKLRQLLAEELPRHLDRDLATAAFAFSAHTREVTRTGIDSLACDGDATDISGALETIKSRLVEQNLCGILLLTDGNYTQGGDPGRLAAEIGLPVHVIGFGSAQQQCDIGITQVEANPFAFAGESTPLRVTVHSTGGQGQRIRLRLEGVTGEVTATTADLKPGPLDSTLGLNYTPIREGRQKLEILLDPGSGDAQRENNRFVLYQDVLKSRTLIFILAGSLSPDLTLLRNHLRADARFDIRLLAELGDAGGLQSSSRFQALQDSIGQGDLFVLYNFPRRTSSPRTVALLQSALSARPRPVLFISGRDPDWQRLKAFEPFLPIRAEATTTGEMLVTALLTPAGQEHPVMQIPGAGITAWNLLPPVYTREQLRAWWPDAEILARAQSGTAAVSAESAATPWPFILVRSSGAKSAAIMGYDLWRWHLMMAGIGNTDEIYHHFFQNLVRWLQIEKSSDLVRVRTDQSTYHFGDEVRLTAQIVDARYQPVDDAEVEVTIRSTAPGHPEGGNEHRPAPAAEPGTLLLTPSGQGGYSGLFRPEQAGEYQIRAEVRRSGQKVGEASHLFSVGSYNEELSDVALKAPLLRRIAALSGGSYAAADSAAAVLEAIHGAKRQRTLTRDTEIWNNGRLLAAILALLAAEWTIRRRKGML
ncbi:MAG TPA: hypothetical protein PKI62_12195 [bacterium]|nr:hypothetical protein [bacterium]